MCMLTCAIATQSLCAPMLPSRLDCVIGVAVLPSSMAIEGVPLMMGSRTFFFGANTPGLGEKATQHARAHLGGLPGGALTDGMFTQWAECVSSSFLCPHVRS